MFSAVKLSISTVDCNSLLPHTFKTGEQPEHSLYFQIRKIWLANFKEQRILWGLENFLAAKVVTSTEALAQLRKASAIDKRSNS